MHYTTLLLLLLSPLALSFPQPQAAPAVVSPDGTCGSTSLLSYTCTNSTYGPCCSYYGYCGSTPTHCEEGCQAGSGTCTEGKANITPDGKCGGTKGYVCPSGTGGKYGNCCSGEGFCGSTYLYCGSTCQESFSAPGTCIKDKVPSLDGKCGPTNGGTNCEGGAFHDLCCSQYGFCGTGAGYCSKAAGCQEGFGAPCTA